MLPAGTDLEGRRRRIGTWAPAPGQRVRPEPELPRSSKTVWVRMDPSWPRRAGRHAQGRRHLPDPDPRRLRRRRRARRRLHHLQDLLRDRRSARSRARAAADVRRNPAPAVRREVGEAALIGAVASFAGLPPASGSPGSWSRPWQRRDRRRAARSTSRRACRPCARRRRRSDRARRHDPALRATRVPPVAALRRGVPLRRSRFGRYAPAVAPLIGAGGIVLLVRGVVGSGPATLGFAHGARRGAGVRCRRCGCTLRRPPSGRCDRLANRMAGRGDGASARRTAHATPGGRPSPPQA